MDLNKLIKKLEGQMKYFTGIIEGLEKFQDKEVTDQLRAELKEFIGKLDKEVFIRKDIDKMITLRLTGMPDQLAEVITIHAIDNKIWVNCDRLWASLEGLNEQIQEAREAQRDIQYNL